MAFANETMTAQEQQQFAARAVPNPGSIAVTLEPTQWTVDRDNNVSLIWGLQEREEPHDYHFVLCWKDAPLAVKLRDRWEDKTRTWELLSLQVPEAWENDRPAIVQGLKDALSAYGYNGSPNKYFDQLNQSTEVRFDF